ncbi:hypothetical protein SLEP1_g55259 [Rubroshorea leprosula]|uniref:Uncharacterized protein n=1 Tax=Rubroshorea leprosula TaxID=152421 RepID=A0AAV5MI10_9ROSI|nr:hypothetical protein SLEP1_g55259 [Rubroshorea leprosula]
MGAHRRHGLSGGGHQWRLDEVRVEACPKKQEYEFEFAGDGDPGKEEIERKG